METVDVEIITEVEAEGDKSLDQSIVQVEPPINLVRYLIFYLLVPENHNYLLAKGQKVSILQNSFAHYVKLLVERLIYFFFPLMH